MVVGVNLRLHRVVSHSSDNDMEVELEAYGRATAVLHSLQGIGRMVGLDHHAHLYNLRFLLNIFYFSCLLSHILAT